MRAIPPRAEAPESVCEGEVNKPAAPSLVSKNPSLVSKNLLSEGLALLEAGDVLFMSWRGSTSL